MCPVTYCLRGLAHRSCLCGPGQWAMPMRPCVLLTRVRPGGTDAHFCCVASGKEPPCAETDLRSLPGLGAAARLRPGADVGGSRGGGHGKSPRYTPAPSGPEGHLAGSHITGSCTSSVRGQRSYITSFSYFGTVPYHTNVLEQMMCEG